MSLFLPPTASNVPEFLRKVTSAVNWLLGKTVQKDGATIYPGATISNPPTQAQVQALADAVQAISARLQ